MSVEPKTAPANGTGTANLLGPLGRLERLHFKLVEISFTDWWVLAYLVNLNVLLWLAPDSPGRTTSLYNMGGLLGFFVLTLVLVRGNILGSGYLGPVLYRFMHFFAATGSYLFFADYLPAVNWNTLDHELYALDLWLFGKEPAILLDNWVTPFTTEWFSFFYYSYFLLIAVHVLPILFFSRSPALVGKLAAGMLIIVCAGQTLYIVVPGFGPTVALPEAFDHTLPAGTWWNTVSKIVAASGAQKDIFPSLHTALPTFLLLFSFEHRRLSPFRYSWPILAFFVANIIIATMFLRWHYVIDVVAGFALAIVAHLVGSRVATWELTRRASFGARPAWPPYGPPKSEQPPQLAPKY